MLATDLAWDPSYEFQFIQDNVNIGLNTHEHRLVIGTKSGSEVTIPSELTYVRDIGPNVREYQSGVPITTDFVSSLKTLENVSFTTPVFVNSSSGSEAVLLNEIIIALEPTVDANRFFEQHDEFSAFRPLDGTSDQFIATVRNGFGPETLDVGIKISDAPGVAWMSPNFYQSREKFYTPNDVRYPNQWNLNNFGQSGGLADADSDVAEAWDVNRGGSTNIVIGIIDDGIDSTHPDLDVWTNPGETNFDGIDNDGNGWIDDIRGWNFVSDTNQTEPVGTDRHGTAVAGVAAARGDNTIGIAGAAYKSRVMSIKIFDSGLVASDASIASAIYYAGGRTRDGLGTWKSADLVNSSWGGGATSALINAALSWGTTSGRQGIGAAYFFASGNDSSSTITGPAAESANIPGVIAVGATNNFGGRSDYSNYGIELDIVAPSSDDRTGYLPIDTTDRIGTPGFALGDYTGIGATGFGQTSAASALSSGIGALVLAQAAVQGISLSPTSLRNLLRNSTDLIGGAAYDIVSGKSTEFGYGRLNAATAVLGVNRAEISVVSTTAEIANRGNVGFAPISVGLYSELILRIRNQGTETLDISSVEMTGPFSLENLGTTSLNVGESTTLTMRFLPISAGSFLGKAIINSNDADEAAFELNLFGSVALTSISGTVYEDYDGDSVFKSFERFLEVPADFAYLDTNNNGIREAAETAVPIANGGYAFEGLAAGTYTVRTEVPGWTVTQPGKNGYVVTLVGASDSFTGVNFGFSKNDRLYSYVYEEINRDGILNVGEPALPGFAVSGTHAYAVTNATAVPIPVRGSVTSTINVADPGTVVSVVVLVNITHPFDSDLTLTLKSPDGTTVLLAQGVGGSGDNFTTTRFSDAGATAISDGTAPFTGIFRPQQALSLFRDVSMLGAWELTINDVKDFDGGQLVNWSLEFQRRFFGVSDPNGWALVDLPTGTNTVGIELQPNWLFSRPATGTYSIVSAALPVYDRPFGIFFDNVPPTDLFLSNSSVNENQAVGAPLGNLTSVDPNRFDNTFTYSLVAGSRPNDNALFRIVGNVLQTNAVFNFEVRNSYLVRIRTTDIGGKFFEREFAITVTNINDTPSALILSPQSVDENKAVASLVGTFATTDEDAGDTHTYSLVTGTGSADNLSFAVLGKTLVTSSVFNFEAKSSYSIRVRTTDQLGLFLDQAFTVTILNVNESALSITLSNNSIAENRGANILVGQFSNNDPDSGDTFTYSLVSGTGSSGNSGFVIAGNQLRSAVGFDFETQSTYPIRVRVTDRAGLTFETNFVINITNVNEASTTISLSKNTILENEVPNTLIGLLSTNDPDLADSILFQFVNGVGSSDNFLFRIVGNQIESAVTLDFEARSSYSVRIRATDKAGSFLERSFVINVLDVNEKPTDILLSANVLLESSPVSTIIGSFQVVDSDANDTHTLTLVSGLGADDNDKFAIVGKVLQNKQILDFETQRLFFIRVRATDASGLQSEKQFNVSVLNVNELPTAIGLSPAEINEGLAVGTTIGTLSTVDVDFGDKHKYELVNNPAFPDNQKFQLVGNELRSGAVFNFDVRNAYSILVRTTDEGGLFIERTLVVTIKNVNDPSSDIGLANRSIAEDKPIGSLVGTFTTVDPDGSDTFVYQLVAGIGSLNNSSFSIVGNQLLTNTALDFEVKSNYSIRVQSRDTGGVTIEKAFVIDVTNVNEISTKLTLSPSTIKENSTLGTVVGTLATQDPDVGDTYSYSLVAGIGSSDNGRFTVMGGSLSTNAVFDFESTNSYSVRVRSTDAGGLSIESSFIVSVTNVNEAPFNLILSGTLLENSPLNVDVLNVSASDMDAGDTLTYSLVAGQGADDNSKFAMTVTGGIRPIVPVDFETQSSYSIRVSATDAGGLSVERAFTVAVVDQNDAPTSLVLSSNSLSENSGAGSSVGVFSTIDPDGQGTFLYSLVSGVGSADNLSFTTIDNELRALVNFDFETKNVYNIRVRSSDPQGLFTEESFVISITDVNETPSSIALSNSSIAENSAVNTVVGLLSTDDVDGGDAFVYTLVPGDGAADNSSFAIVDNQLQALTPFDFEANGSYSIRVRSTDLGGLSTESPFAILVSDSNELPTNLQLSSSSVNENVPIGSLIGNLSATDPDAVDSLTFRFVSGNNDNSKFSLNGNQLLSAGAFDFELKGSYRVEIQVIDKSLNGPSLAFLITINDVNEGIVDLNLSNSTVDENVLSGSLVGILTAVDPDVAEVHQFSLSVGAGDADNGKFSIVGNELRLLSSPNFESQSSYAIRVLGIDRGGLSFLKSFTINVRNLPEEPTALSLSNSRIRENQGASALVGTLSTTDPDGGDIFTYSFVAGIGSTHNALFALINGNLVAKNSLDFESNANLFVRVRATDSSQQFVERSFVIVVENVNEAPTNITAPSNTIAENRPAGTLVSVLSTTDSDLGETYSYSLVPTPTAGDNFRFEIVGNEVRTNRKLNFEAQSSHQLRIRSTDSTGLFVEVPFTVIVTNVNELAIIAAADSASTPTNSSVVIDVLANDRDPDGSIDPSTVTIVSAPTSGTVRVLPDGRIEYTPPTDQRLTSTFTYSVKDNDEVVSNVALVSIKVYSGYQNQLNALDVDADGSITPLDVLTLVNDINRNGLRDLPNGVPSSAPYLDTNGNGKVDPLDVLEIVNFLNASTGLGGEGESRTDASNVDHAFATLDMGTLVREVDSNAFAMLSVDEYFHELDSKRNKRR